MGISSLRGKIFNLCGDAERHGNASERVWSGRPCKRREPQVQQAVSEQVNLALISPTLFLPSFLIRHFPFFTIKLDHCQFFFL